jgi:hypothetical protein
MMDCSAALLENAPLDPKKLPNYVFGMVLGPTDFRQVLENFEWKHRNSNLLLHGSGTVCGLKVSSQLLTGGTDVQIAVSAGFAISPRGRWIRVERDQCAPLNQWLHTQTSLPYASPGPGAHQIYVTLCYNQCLTDLVPIAGQQCAPDADNQAPSRILESFNLQFSWTPPPQPLEDRARLFGALMRRVEIIDTSASLPGGDDSQRLFTAVRALALDPLPLPGSLPDGGPFRLTSADADATIREALTIWVTEICPAVRPKPEASPLLDPAADDCILLAAIDFNVNSLGQLIPGSIAIDETHRPVLVPSRILQELFTGAGGAGPGGRAEGDRNRDPRPAVVAAQFVGADDDPDSIPAGLDRAGHGGRALRRGLGSAASRRRPRQCRAHSLPSCIRVLAGAADCRRDQPVCSKYPFADGSLARLPGVTLRCPFCRKLET